MDLSKLIQKTKKKYKPMDHGAEEYKPEEALEISEEKEEYKPGIKRKGSIMGLKDGKFDNAMTKKLNPELSSELDNMSSPEKKEEYKPSIKSGKSSKKAELEIEIMLNLAKNKKKK